MRTDVVIGKKNEVFLHIQAEPHVCMELSDHFTFDVEGAKFSPAYRNKYWDGKIRLFSTATGEIYCGLLDKIVSFCDRHDYTNDSATITGNVQIYYGRMNGNGIGVNMTCESKHYKFTFNIRNKQASGPYPTHMMCDYKKKAYPKERPGNGVA